MCEQAELQGTQMGPNGPPNATGTASITPEIDILENRAFGTETAILVISASHFRARVATPKKAPLGIRLKPTRPSYMRIWPEPNPPEARQIFILAGVSIIIENKSTQEKSLPRRRVP